MDLIAETVRRRFYHSHIADTMEIEAIALKNPFPCVLWDHNSGFSVEQISAVLERLLDAGCTYFVCGGEQCERLHDITDEIDVIRKLDSQDSVNIMSIWHNDETPDEVIAFFLDHAVTHKGQYVDNLLITMGTSNSTDIVDLLRAKVADAN